MSHIIQMGVQAPHFPATSLSCVGGKFSEKEEMDRGHLQKALGTATDARSGFRRQDQGAAPG